MSEGTGRKQIFLSDVERDLLSHSLRYLHSQLAVNCKMNETQKTAQSFCHIRLDNLIARLEELDKK